ncbi:MAG: c-type cytochrome [Proteobacteria bacterium]|nr:c-type cytochrome [Pseudomonadota bacterium]
MKRARANAPQRLPIRAAAGAALVVGMGLLSAWAFAQRTEGSAGAAAAPAAPGVAAAGGAPGPSADPLVERGRYLARVADCVSCHTAPGGAPFAGGLPMKTPFGTIVSTNITPDRNAGIGTYSEADFARALRQGVAADGHHLYPAMPYPSFARTTDADIRALYAFFQKGVEPVATRPTPTDLPFPFSIRGLMVFWNWLYLDSAPYAQQAAQSAEWNRGAYLVQGLGHCGDCHTPRSRLGGVKAANERDGDPFLAGALVDGWYAQPLRHTDRPGAVQWRTQDIVEYLQTGRTAQTAAFGPMVQVVENSTQHMTAEDLKAIAVYLQSVGAPAPGATAGPASPSALRAAATDTPEAKKLRDGQVDGVPGSMVYLNNCSACHRSSGVGWDNTFPALAGNSVVNAKDPTSLIRLVLGGSAMPSTARSPAAIAMPAFGWRLSDADVAEVLSFARRSWGNRADAVTAAQVAAVRKTAQAPAEPTSPAR